MANQSPAIATFESLAWRNSQYHYISMYIRETTFISTTALFEANVKDQNT